MNESEVEREVLRLNRRYLEEVVERFSLCPWAERSRRDGQVKECVFQQKSPDDLGPTLLALGALEAEAETEIGLFIYPLLDLGRLDFEHFVRRLRTAESDRHELGSQPFAMAAFHPDAAAQLEDPERLIPFLRRSPYPTIQVVRQSALDRVRRGEKEGTGYFDLELLGAARLEPPQVPLRERIARANLATVREVGVSALEAVLGDIVADRDRTHARLKLTKPA